MKRFLILLTILILTLSNAQISKASPLVFKTEKTIEDVSERDFTELAVFDTSKYKQIRVGVILLNGTPKKIGNTTVGNYIQIEAVEDKDVLFLQGFEVVKSKSITIESPPTKIKISVKESGTYKIFIWAS